MLFEVSFKDQNTQRKLENAHYSRFAAKLHHILGSFFGTFWYIEWRHLVSTSAGGDWHLLVIVTVNTLGKLIYLDVGKLKSIAL